MVKGLKYLSLVSHYVGNASAITINIVMDPSSGSINFEKWGKYIYIYI